MANVTYLLGAGASCNVLPTYKNFKERFELFANLFKGGEPYHYAHPELKREAKELFFTIQEILNEFKYHNTPDTIAKKLFHSSDPNSPNQLNRLKQLITLFFLYEQTVETPVSINKNVPVVEYTDVVDKRYDALLSGILKPIEGKLEIINSFKILTWNYDLQFELAYSRMSNESLIDVQEKIQSYPKIIPSKSKRWFNVKDFSIIHLNGIAYYKNHYKNESGDDLLGKVLPYNQQMLESLIQINRSMNKTDKDYDYESLFKFAWENLNHDFTVTDNQVFNNASEIALNTEILVIIGYSFPIFNSSIDNLIMDKMRGNLKKVYVQSPIANQIIELLRNSHLRWLPSSCFHAIEHTESFSLPVDWNTDYNNYSFE